MFIYFSFSYLFLSGAKTTSNTGVRIIGHDNQDSHPSERLAEYIYIYIYIHTHTHTYTYIHRERDGYIYIYIYIYICVCVYIHIYIYINIPLAEFTFDFAPPGTGLAVVWRSIA